MKILFFFLCLLPFSIGHAETYKWQDENGMHFTDNASSIPLKYREKVLEEARQNSLDQHSSTATPFSRSNGISPQGVRPEYSYQPSFERKPFPQESIHPPQFPAHRPKRVHAPGSIEEAFLPLAKFMTAIIAISIAIGVVWVITLVDILRSEFTDSSNKIVWFFLVLFLPVLGIFLYGIIGLDQKKEGFSGRDKTQMELMSRIHPDKSKDGDFEIM
jgi:hypothetical protein